MHDKSFKTLFLDKQGNKSGSMEIDDINSASTTLTATSPSSNDLNWLHKIAII